MSRSEYIRADTNDTTTNVPLLATDSMDDDNFPPDQEESQKTSNSQNLEGGRVNLRFEQPQTGLFRSIRPTKLTALVAVIFVLFMICIVLGVMLAKSCSKQNSHQKDQTGKCVTEGCIDAAYHISHSMNSAVKPCDDFYEFACGGWAEKNPIPASKPLWAVYLVLEEENRRSIRQLLTDSTVKSASARKAKTYYDACMDETEINVMGAKPLQGIIKLDIGGWSINNNATGKPWDESKWDLSDMLATVQRKYAVYSLFETGVSIDDKNSSKHVIKIDQGGLPLPRTYYLANETDKRLVAYLKYMTKIGTLLGGDKKTIEEQMKEVLRFEMNLSKIFVPQNNRSQIDELYNKSTIRKLQKLCPKIQWRTFLGGLFKGIVDDITEDEEVVLYATRYLDKLSDVIKSAPKRVLNNYMVWQVVFSLAPSLSDDFRNAHEELNKVLTGARRSEDLWKRCIGETDGAIGMVLGALFVNKTFEGSSKQQATEMIDAIRTSFKKALPGLDWMDEKTRLAAEDKADAVVDMIGFPPYILEEKELQKKYATLHFTKKGYFQNRRNAMVFNRMDNLKELRQPVDKHRWYMTPSTVNAYYNPSGNQIVFPAGILQAPYYDKKLPKVINFGGIGTVVGHELSHAFDNSGRMYDKYGNYGNLWWTNKSVEQYKKRSECMVKQYSKYAYFGKNVKGKFTLGENIADNGGLKAAYNAYKQWEKEHGVEPPLPLLNMTADQTFFTAFAQNWCAIIRKQWAVVKLDDDPHSPNKFRVLGSLSNFPPFAKAFNCPVDSRMNPKKKCSVW